MRILHVVPSFGFGGMEKILCAVIESTGNRHQHAILALDGRTEAAAWVKTSNIQLINFVKSQSRFRFFRSLYDALRISGPDLLMTFNWGATDAIWLGRIAGLRKIIHHEHGFSVEEGTSTLRRRDYMRAVVYRLASKVIVVSHELEEMCRKRIRIREACIKRIANGIDTAVYSPNEGERQRIRRSLGYGESEVVLGFAGRLDAVKNLDLLLDIFNTADPRIYPFRLLIIGDGPERKRLEARCRSAGIDRYVQFAGQREEVLCYLRAMDVFALTSIREQMPLIVLEAMAVGLPVITTRVGELPHIIHDGANGFIRDRMAPLEFFIQPLRSLLCLSLRRRLGSAARKTVIEHFQLKFMLQQYYDMIHEFEN